MIEDIVTLEEMAAIVKIDPEKEKKQKKQQEQEEQQQQVQEGQDKTIATAESLASTSPVSLVPDPCASSRTRLIPAAVMVVCLKLFPNSFLAS